MASRLDLVSNPTFSTQIELLEILQGFHQKCNQLHVHFLSPGPGLLSRHVANLPRLVLSPAPAPAQLIVGSSAQLLAYGHFGVPMLCNDILPPASALVTPLLLQGFRCVNSRLLIPINKLLPAAQRIRILVLTNLYPPQELGGYGRSIFDFAANLRQLGHHISVLTSDAPYLGGDCSIDHDVSRSLLLLGSYEGGLSFATSQSDVERINLHNRLQLIHELSICVPHAVLAGNLDMLSPELLHVLADRQIPCLHHHGFSGPAFPDALLPSPGSSYQPVANSRFTAKAIESVNPRFSSVPVVYPGAQTHLFSDLESPSLGGALHIAFAGLLISAKGPHVLLEALGQLQTFGIPFRCELAGGHMGDGYRDQLLDFTKSTGISERIVFLGKLDRSQLRALFARNQVFVFPSTWEEPFGISQVEALAAGLLVVSSGTGGAGETVHDDINGRCFRSSDSIHLAEVLREVYLYPEQHEHLRVRGRKLAFSHFDTARETRKLSGLLVQAASVRSSVGFPNE